MRLVEAVLLENYKDAERIFAAAYAQSRLFIGRPANDANTMAMVHVRRFRQYAQENLIDSKDKDISKWIGVANRVDSQRAADDLYFRFSDVLKSAEDKIPEYEVVGSRGKITVTALLNYAAVKKLCNRMSVCIRSNPNDFDSYSSTGALFLVEVGPTKYVFEYNRPNDGGAIWTAMNEEMTLDEFFTAEGLMYIPRFDPHDEQAINDALEYFEDEFRLHRRGGLF